VRLGAAYAQPEILAPIAKHSLLAQLFIRAVIIAVAVNTDGRREVLGLEEPLIGAASDLPDFITYSITIELSQPAATVEAVRECYVASDLVARTS
jgi:hypothetical protein